MFNANLTEVALRKAALEMVTDNKSVDDIQQSALEHVGSLIKSQFDADQQGKQMGLQQDAIAVAVKAIAVAWQATTEQLQRLGRARLDFDKERKSGISTFLIPSNKEHRDRWAEQNQMESFLSCIKNDREIFNYMGLKESTVEQPEIKVEGTFLSCIPYYQMSQYLPEPLASFEQVEKTRRVISLFFKTEVPKYIKDVNEDFDSDSKFADFFRSAWRGDNFLNNYRGPRMVVMTLSNLLWNLQHPVDLKTGFPLSLDKKIALCRKVSMLINQLLDKNTPPLLDKINSDGSLINFISQVETYVSELKMAYEEEKLQALNIDDISNQAYGTARILNDNIFQLIFDKGNMAARLASSIGYLNLLLKREPKILSVVSRFDVGHPLQNYPSKTLVDVLLVFLQLRGNQRKQFLSYLNSLDNNSAQCFSLTLSNLNKDFVKPIYRACRKELRPTVRSPKRQEAQHMAFNKILPLIGLALNDYGIEIDSDEIDNYSLRAKRFKQTFLTGQNQIIQITNQAYQNKHFDQFDFNFDMSCFLELSHSAEAKLNQLPRHQYKIGHLTSLLDDIQSFITSYKSFLQYPKFKQFILKTLDETTQEFNRLKRLLEQLDNSITVNNTANRRVIGMIKSMDLELLTEITNFTQMINSVEEKMLSPEFESGLKKELLAKLRALGEKFSLAFEHHDSELDDLLDNLGEEWQEGNEDDSSAQNRQTIFSPENHEQQPSQRKISAGQAIAVSNLILNCYYHLSAQSKSSHKGAMLLNINQRLQSKQQLTENDIKQTLTELARIVCAYRPSLFFQATYGQTKSATFFINALVNNKNNANLPLYQWLFAEAVPDQGDLHQLIADKLRQTQGSNHWAQSTTELADSRLFELEMQTAF